jgi:hypothetical protein
LPKQKASINFPIIHWVTSGILGLIPLHAAGHHDGMSTENAVLLLNKKVIILVKSFDVSILVGVESGYRILYLLVVEERRH